MAGLATWPVQTGSADWLATVIVVLARTDSPARKINVAVRHSVPIEPVVMTDVVALVESAIRTDFALMMGSASVSTIAQTENAVRTVVAKAAELASQDSPAMKPLAYVFQTAILAVRVLPKPVQQSPVLVGYYPVWQ
jgi:hypothetical protein